MTAKVSDYRNSLYHREYANDVPEQTHVVYRTFLAALPFLSLHSSFRLPITLGMSGLRAWNAEGISRKAMAVAAIAGAVFKHPAGQILTTVDDLIQEIHRLRGCKTREEALQILGKIINNLVYLALMTRGGLELAILSFAIQTAMSLVESNKEWKKGRWIEGCAQLLMAAVRLRQTYTHCKQLQRNRAIEEALKRVHVGKLHEKWRFPSDHLPVGVEVNGVRIISWNVLNNAYMEWVTEKDSQGLNGSLISELDKSIAPGLTLRDVLVADLVQEMTSKGDVVALQECGAPFLELLAQRLPPNWGMVKSFNSPREDQDVVLYNSSRLTFSPEASDVTTSAYPSFPDRPLQNAFFSDRNGGNSLQIINAHIPGNPDKPGKEEFAQYVHQHHRDDAVTVALGDNNFDRDEMIQAYRQAGFTDFSLHSPWKTNIDPYTKESKGIDHLFVMGTDESRDLQPSEVLQSGHLQETIDLLSTARSGY